MKWRWLFFDFIPPDVTVDPRLRREIRLAVKRHTASSWDKQAIIRSAVALPFLIAIFAITYWLLWNTFSALPLALSYLALHLAAVVVYAPSRARSTYLALHLHGIDVCVKCGYSLRELPSSVLHCPECGMNRLPLPSSSPLPTSNDPS